MRHTIALGQMMHRIQPLNKRRRACTRSPYCKAGRKDCRPTKLAIVGRQKAINLFGQQHKRLGWKKPLQQRQILLNDRRVSHKAPNRNNHRHRWKDCQKSKKRHTGGNQAQFRTVRPSQQCGDKRNQGSQIGHRTPCRTHIEPHGKAKPFRPQGWLPLAYATLPIATGFHWARPASFRIACGFQPEILRPRFLQSIRNLPDQRSAASAYQTGGQEQRRWWAMALGRRNASCHIGW